MKFFKWLKNLFKKKPIKAIKTRKSAVGTVRRNWTENDIDFLVSEWDAGSNLYLIAEILNRTPNAIRRKLYDLNISSKGHLSSVNTTQLPSEEEIKKCISTVDSSSEPQSLYPDFNQLTSFNNLPNDYPRQYHHASLTLTDPKSMYINPLIKPDHKSIPISLTSDKPLNSHRAWTIADDTKLLQLHHDGASVEQLQNIFNRSKNSILARLSKYDSRI